jgi:hypothetical protein
MKKCTRPHLHKFQQSPRLQRIFLGRAMTALLVESMLKGMAAQACSDQPGVSALDIEKLTSDVDGHYTYQNHSIVLDNYRPFIYTITKENNPQPQLKQNCTSSLPYVESSCQPKYQKKTPYYVECSKHIHTKITHHCTEQLKALEIQRKTIHSQN